MEQIEFSDRWSDWRGEDEASARQRSRLEEELRREVADGHQLVGVDASAMASCQHCDDVVFRTADGRFAVVHLSYPKVAPDHPPWPHTDVLGTADALRRYLVEHEDA